MISYCSLNNTDGISNLSGINVSDGDSDIIESDIQDLRLGTLTMTNTINKIDKDGTLAANSDLLLSTQKAIKTYSDSVSGSVSSALTSHVNNNTTAHFNQDLKSSADVNFASVTANSVKGRSLSANTWIMPCGTFVSDYARSIVFETFSSNETDSEHHVYLLKTKASGAGFTMNHYSLSGNASTAARCILIEAPLTNYYYLYFKTAADPVVTTIVIKEYNETTTSLVWASAGTSTYPDDRSDDGGLSLAGGYTNVWDSNSTLPNAESRFGDITSNTLTASSLVASDANKTLKSVSISDYITGTSNQITVTGTNSLVLSTPQALDTDANVSFSSLKASSICGRSLSVNVWTKPFENIYSDCYGRHIVLSTLSYSSIGGSNHTFQVRFEPYAASASVSHFSLCGNLAVQPRVCIFKRISVPAYYLYIKTDDNTSSRVTINEHILVSSPLLWQESGTANFPTELSSDSGVTLGANFSLEWDSDNSASYPINSECRFGKITSFDTTDASSSVAAGSIVKGGLAVAKKIYSGTGLYLPSTAGTATLLDYYEEGTHNTTWGSTVFASAVTANIDFTRIGNKVTLDFSIPTTAAVTSSYIGITTVLPTRLRPVTAAKAVVSVKDDSIQVFGNLIVYSTGDIRIYVGADGGVFQATGTAGCQYVFITYLV